MTIRTAISTIGQSVTVTVTNESATEPLPQRTGVIQLFEDPTHDCNARTTISVSSGGAQDDRSIEFYWLSAPYNSEAVGILAIERTGVIFIGAGRLLAVVNLATGQVLNERTLQLFWSLEHLHSSVLLRSELECCVFNERGVLEGSVAVDPPWKERVESAGIHFQSIVYGHAFLPWCAA
jgi:hypothetical protein